MKHMDRENVKQQPKNECHESYNVVHRNSKRNISEESSKLTLNGGISKDCISSSSTNISSPPLCETKKNTSDHTIS